MPLFNRQIEVVLSNSGLQFSSEMLRIDFDITKTTDMSSNPANLKVYNLATDSRNRIQQLDDNISIYAGYTDDVGAKLIFTGEILKIIHEHSPPEIITNIEAGDGISFLREKRGAVSFERGTNMGTVLGDLATRLGLPIRNLPKLLEGQYLHGFSHAGSLKDALDRVTTRQGLEWSIQNGELMVLPKRAPLDGSAIEISSEQGMLGAPERLRDLGFNLVTTQRAPGFKVRTLLNPLIEAGSKVRLSSVVATGDFRVEVVTHVGSNFTNDFYTEMEIYELWQ